METTSRYDNEPLLDERSAPSEVRTTVAAVFADRERAHDAIHELRDDGFRDTWIGITRRDESDDYTQTTAQTTAPYVDPERAAGLMPWGEPLGGAAAAYDLPVTAARGALDEHPDQTTRVESDNWFMRFFGEGDESLHDALVRHGVTEADARAAGELPDHSAIVTVDGANHPEMAAEILSQCGGRVITRGFGGASTAFAERSVTPEHEVERAAHGDGRATRGDFITREASRALHGDAMLDDVTRSADHDEKATAFSELTMTPEEQAREEAYAPRATSDLGGRNSLDPISTPDASTPETGRPQAGTPKAGTRPGFLRSGEAGRSQGATAYDDYGRFRGGSPIDESTRLQLRQERLSVDKSRVSRGEAAVSTDVMSESQEIDVPVVREELFIERRPTTGDVRA
jgi:hypothetical protein